MAGEIRDSKETDSRVAFGQGASISKYFSGIALSRPGEFKMFGLDNPKLEKEFRKKTSVRAARLEIPKAVTPRVSFGGGAPISKRRVGIAMSCPGQLTAPNRIALEIESCGENLYGAARPKKHSVRLYREA